MKRTTAPVMKSVELPNGVAIPYAEQGDLSGYPVVLLHAIADEIFAEKYLSHQSDGTALERGSEDVKKFIMEYRTAFSEIEDIVEDMIGEGDRVVTRWTLRVTHTGEFRGIPATGKRITITGIGIFRFSQEGKVVESWDSLDQLGMLRQLGVPAPQQFS